MEKLEKYVEYGKRDFLRGLKGGNGRQRTGSSEDVEDLDRWWCTDGGDLDI